jgi:hypothetical protein
MRIIYALILFFSFVTFLSGCKQNNGKEKSTGGSEFVMQDVVYNDYNECIEIDVEKEYPERELHFDELVEAEYIPLETTDDILCEERGKVIAVTDSIIIFANWKEGSIFIFDRRGKFLTKINRRGGSGEEYAWISQASFDEVTEELYVNDMLRKKISVYNLKGEYKRGFHHEKGLQYDIVVSFNDSMLLCHDTYLAYSKEKRFTIISKQTGKIWKDLKIPYNENALLAVVNDRDDYIAVAPPMFPMLQYHNHFFITEQTSDTVYIISPTERMRPALVRNPPIETMNVPYFIVPHLVTNRYLFMMNVKKQYSWETSKGFPMTPLIYDNKDRKIYSYTMMGMDFITNPDKLATVYRYCYTTEKDLFVAKIEAFELKQKEEELTGKLKEVASRVNEDDNPVLMLMKFKE